MKKTVFLFVGLLFTGLSALAQINTLPHTQSFNDEFITGIDVEFIDNWTGNEVEAATRISRETTNFNSAPAALSIIPTGSFDGEVIVDLNLATYSDVSLSFVAKSMANGTGDRPTKLEIATSTDGGITWSTDIEIGEFPNEDQTAFAPFSYDLPASANQAPSVKVRFSITTGTGGGGTRAKLIIDDVVFDGTEGSSTTPVLTLTPATLEFSQTLGAPSAAQSVSVYGANLVSDITLNTSAPFEIALTEEGAYATTQTLSLTDGGFSGNVFVRLNSATAGSFTEVLTATAGTFDASVSLSGEVTASLVVNPAPFDLSTGNYTFTEWDSEADAGTYPNNMRFWTHESNAPSIATEFKGNWVCVYNLSSRSRILGEGTGGVSFIQTGDPIQQSNCPQGEPGSGNTIANGHIGTAVVALNATGRENIQVEWTGTTIAPNNRVYALRLQYRIGDGNGNPNVGWQDFSTISEYVTNETAGHSQDFTVTLPADADNEAVVQLRWVYFQHESNTASGTRAHLGLDDITVSSDEFLSVSGFEQNSFRMYPNPATSTVNFSKELTATVFDITGKKVLSFENATSVNVSQLSKGVYFVKTNEGATSKLIVK